MGYLQKMIFFLGTWGKYMCTFGAFKEFSQSKLGSSERHFQVHMLVEILSNDYHSSRIQIDLKNNIYTGLITN